MDTEQFQKDPRSFALELWEEGLVGTETIIQACLNFMSHDDVRQMLDNNELSPRFLNE
jgi:hypothetical protein